MNAIHPCGLDFGTSNSTIGLFKGNKPALCPVEGAHVTMPSAVFFDSENNTVCYGRHAISEYVEGAEGRLMRGLKSVLGTSLMRESTPIGRRRVSFQEVLGSFVGHLKQQAEQGGYGGHSQLKQVVVGRPVFFVDSNPEADKQAQNTLEAIVKSQGFEDVAFQYEPVAAALDYEQSVTTEQQVLIVDLGGGTSDFSVVRVSPAAKTQADRGKDVLGNIGVHIGGTDFDRLLSLHTAMPHLGYGTKMRDAFDTQDLTVPGALFYDLATWQKINFLYTKKTQNTIKSIAYTAFQPELFQRFLHLIEDHKGHSLALEVEKTKINLTDMPQTTLDMSFIERGLAPIATQQDLNTAIHDATNRLQQTCQQVLIDAGTPPESIRAVFLTGGSTAIPFVRQSLLTLLPHAQVVEGDRFGSVGIGLTLDAKRVFGG